jgi:DnaK suppressor protein
MGPMNKKDLKRFRGLLLEKRNDLLARVRDARSSDAESSGAAAPDLGDRALSTVSRDLLYQLSAGERDVLRRIDAALDRMEAGTYGDCVHCKKKVQKGRLEAVPWARHCIECQELQDRGEI